MRHKKLHLKSSPNIPRCCLLVACIQKEIADGRADGIVVCLRSCLLALYCKRLSTCFFFSPEFQDWSCKRALFFVAIYGVSLHVRNIFQGSVGEACFVRVFFLYFMQMKRALSVKKTSKNYEISASQLKGKKRTYFGLIALSNYFSPL